VNAFFQFIPKDGAQIVLVLFLSFLIGLEREEHKALAGAYTFGGVRTFPLIGLFGYGIALISGQSLVLPAAGLLMLGALLWLSYQHKLQREEFAGLTTEISAALMYVIGMMVHWEAYWIATTLTVIAVGLLELKNALENLTKTIPGEEILTFAKFLLLTAVILPVVPNQTFGDFGFNPRKAWWVVVAVSAVSYGSYLLYKAVKGKGDVPLSAILGGLYSSTVTTVVLSKRAKDASRPHLYSGATLMASGVMYLRLLALIAIFSRGLFARLHWQFLLLALLGIAGGFAWTRIPEAGTAASKQDYTPKNPLELSAAFFFGGLFVLLLYITHLALTHLGSAGLYGLAAVMGVTDVDPFILGLTQSAGGLTPVEVAAIGVAIAAASNNMVKGVYAYSFADRRTGLQSLALLAGLAVLGLIPLMW
jgi:uncharacterized membrane protein (DUF4010 family)